MNWLDLGWLKRGSDWREFHPWGPFNRGYLLPETMASDVRNKVRWIRALMVVAAVAASAAALALKAWWPVVVAGLVGGGAEWLFTWLVVRRLSRTESSMGLSNGLVYLARWSGPKLLTLARMAAWVLVLIAILIVWREQAAGSLYLLVAAFVAVQFLLNYLEQVQRFKGQ